MNANDIELSMLEGFEQVALIIGNRPLYHFSHVSSFHYFNHIEEPSGDTRANIELVLEEFEPPRARIGIKFHQVADVAFSGFGQIMGLFFQDIRERGWEKLRFEVGDYEDGRIHLFCHNISLFDPGNVALKG